MEPATFDVDKFFKAIDAAGGADFMEDGRQQPEMPKEDMSFD